METTKLYYEDAYLREFDAAVLSCREEQGRYLVVLDRTAFYPEGAPACASALDAAILLERQKLCIAVKSPEVHQNSALPTVRGCSSTSRMLLTPVRYITIRSKPRPKPACLQEP